MWASLHGRPPIPEDLVVLAGLRSLSPAAEARRLADSAIHVVPQENGRPGGDLAAALDQLPSQADGFTCTSTMTPSARRPRLASWTSPFPAGS